jgi:hypothetical protein
MKNSATVKINGEERSLNFAFVGCEEVIGAALGLISNPMDYTVQWKMGEREGRLIPSERMVPEDGMEFTVSRR